MNYARYAFRGNGFNLVMYQSGKLVIQGKGAEEFVLFTIEPQVTLQFNHNNEEFIHPEWYETHAGMDESGKGDFFGAVVTACVVADSKQIKQLKNIGVKDSKSIASDKAVLEIERKMYGIDGIVIEIMSLSMGKYNELYQKFGANLNRLLGWMHSCSLKNALQRRYVPRGVLDQFSKSPITQSFVKRDYPEFVLDMHTKAESDPVVAAASIAARAAYIRQMEALSKEANVTLLKGASQQVKNLGKELNRQFGAEGLAKYCKTHFKTYKEILSEASGN